MTLVTHKNYICDNENCRIHEDGPYKTINECEQNCKKEPTKYKCNNGNCNLDKDGTWDDIKTCYSNCPCEKTFKIKYWESPAY